jgi:alpha-galactosidase
MKKIIVILLALTTTGLYAQKFTGLAVTPPMGWNSWNTFQTNIDEKLVMQTADIIVSSGMKDAGYTYLVLDDGWMAKERDKDGNLVPDPQKFPRGIKVVADYVHSKGLKFGLYNCAGTMTCAGYPGTRGYEYQDARNYAAWDVDYLKFDWCYTDGINAKEAYTTMSKALKTAGRPIIFSLCEWGQHNPWEWAAPVGQLWRATGDIGPNYDTFPKRAGWNPLSVMNIVDLVANIRQYAGPDHWNDPDMLEVGNGMTVSEDRTHFTMWCMLAAPLMMGNDLRKMGDQTHTVLTDKGAVAVDQDALGVQALRYSKQNNVETWFKPLADGGWAVCFLNRAATPQKISFDWKNENVTDTLSSKQLNATSVTYSIHNIWTNKDAGTTNKPFETEIPAHDVVFLRLAKK